MARIKSSVPPGGEAWVQALERIDYYIIDCPGEKVC